MEEEVDPSDPRFRYFSSTGGFPGFGLPAIRPHPRHPGLRPSPTEESKRVRGRATELEAWDLPYLLGDLQNHAVDAWRRLGERYPDLDASDPRVMVAHNIRSITTAVFLNSLYLVYNLTDPDWWHSVFTMDVEHDDAADDLDGYVLLMTMNLFTFNFSVLEAGLRRVVRALDPTLDPSMNFGRIVPFLLRRLRSQGWDFREADAFFDLMRMIRNTLHTNGYFIPYKSGDQVIQWKGTSYRFTLGRRLDFLDWHFQRRAVGELISLNESIMMSPTVAALPPF